MLSSRAGVELAGTRQVRALILEECLVSAVVDLKTGKQTFQTKRNSCKQIPQYLDEL